MALLVTRNWKGRPIRENGKLNIDASWFNGGRLAGMASYSFSKVADITYDLFTAAALSEQLAAFNLDAKEVIQDVIIRPTTAFSGGGATSVTMSFGITGNSTKYFPVPYDVTQNSNVGHYRNTLILPDSWSAETSLFIELTSDVNVADLTAGVAEIYVNTSILP